MPRPSIVRPMCRRTCRLNLIFAATIEADEFTHRACARMVVCNVGREVRAVLRSCAMEIYLPVAEISVNWLIIVSLGLGVGFLSACSGWAAAF